MLIGINGGYFPAICRVCFLFYPMFLIETLYHFRFRYLVPPLKDIDFRNYLDDEGSLIKPDELRLLVYQIGVEHSLRKVVWKHLLNVYPTKPRLLTGAER